MITLTWVNKCVFMRPIHLPTQEAMLDRVNYSIQAILARQELFSSLDAASLAALAKETLERGYDRGEVLFHKGDTPQGIHVVVSGQIKLAIPSPQGSEKILHLANPGDTFGEAVVFLDKPYPVTAQATLDSVVLLVLKPALKLVLGQNPALSSRILPAMSSRLHRMVSDVETCTQMSSLQRVIGFLTQDVPRTSGERLVVNLGTSKQNIASQLNLAPETFSRVLNQLSTAKLVEVHGRLIIVHDVVKLIAYGESAK